MKYPHFFSGNCNALFFYILYFGFQKFYNIIKNIYVPSDISNDAFFTTTYQGNIPFTTLSYQIYGTTYLWWLICIVNNIKNPFDPANSGKTLKIIKPNYINLVLTTISQQLQ